jgi:hypothetical protein
MRVFYELINGIGFVIVDDGREDIKVAAAPESVGHFTVLDSRYFIPVSEALKHVGNHDLDSLLLDIPSQIEQNT